MKWNLKNNLDEKNVKYTLDTLQSLKQGMGFFKQQVSELCAKVANALTRPIHSVNDVEQVLVKIQVKPTLPRESNRM